MNTHYAEKHRRHQPAGGSGCACIAFFLLGLLVAGMSAGRPAGLILAAILILLAVVCNPRSITLHWCGRCGNEVSQTSLTCPHCSARLTPPRRDRQFDPIWLAFVIVAFLIALLLACLQLVA